MKQLYEEKVQEEKRVGKKKRGRWKWSPRERRERKGELGKERGEERGKRERETRRGSRTQWKNFTEVLKKKKNFLSVSQDYPPLNNLFFFTAIQTIRVFLINSAIKITVIDLAG